MFIVIAGNLHIYIPSFAEVLGVGIYLYLLIHFLPGYMGKRKGNYRFPWTCKLVGILLKVCSELCKNMFYN